MVLHGLPRLHGRSAPMQSQPPTAQVEQLICGTDELGMPSTAFGGCLNDNDVDVGGGPGQSNVYAGQ